jgi:type IV pilus assembly protein PilA
MNRFATWKRRGFTLIELLVVVLILSILMAVALPLYLSAVADSQKKVCRANMQTISNVVQAAYVRQSPNPGTYSAFFSTLGTTVPPNLSDLSSIPVCPNAGTYTIAAGNGGVSTFQVSCSYVGSNAHGTFQPGVNSN